MSNFQSTKVIELGSCAFRQWGATDTRCSLTHGYKLTAKFWFGCSELDARNWAVNFGGLKELKQVLNDQFDHTTCIDAADPLLPLFKTLHDAGGCDLRIMEKGVGIERTAEWCFEAADKHIRTMTSDRCWVEQVEVFEHELNSAIYSKSQRADAAPILSPDVVYSQLTTLPVAAITAEQVQTIQTIQNNSRAAHVGPNVSSGKGDWFKGTSWGE